jgi:hypothetical protein
MSCGVFRPASGAWPVAAVGPCEVTFSCDQSSSSVIKLPMDVIDWR